VKHLRERRWLHIGACPCPCCCIHAYTWLSYFLQVTWPKTLLVVSHAREFLNAVTTDTIHLHSRKLTTYKGAVWATLSTQ
jgi:ATPase subunit of ABC transporter with duplicated ATPase domains